MIENKLRQWVETVRRKPAPLTEAIPMVCQAADEIEALRARVAELEKQRGELLAALEAADRFITNGIALGFIRMPDADCPDPAHKTPEVIRTAIAGAKGSA